MNRFHKFICIFLAGCLALTLAGCGKAKNAKKPPRRPVTASTERQFLGPQEGDTIAVFHTNLGEVHAVLYHDAAPMAVENFVGLARSGYYDGTIIWRSEYGFAVQGGDATGTGTGGATIWSNHPYPLEADGTLCHYAGALCAAFSEAGGLSQFYFVQALPDSVDKTMQEQLDAFGYTPEQVSVYAAVGGLPQLDNTDTVFGMVYEGMDVVDAMACVDTVQEEYEDEKGKTQYRDTFRPTEEAAIIIDSITVSVYSAGADETAEPETAEGESPEAAKAEG